MNFVQITVVTLLICVINARPNHNIDSNLRIKIIRLHSSEESSEEVNRQGSSCGYSVSLCRRVTKLCFS